MDQLVRVVFAAIAMVELCAAVAGEPRQMEWPGYNNGYDSQRYSPLRQITAANAGDLRVACDIGLGDAGLFQAGLVVADGTMFATTGHTTVALDPANCKERWRHLYVAEEKEINPVNRGVAYLDGRVFRGTADGRLLALDAKTGKELWRVRAANPQIGEFFNAAPIAWRGLVFIGPAGSDWGIKGWMAAYDATSGKRVWRFNTIPDAGEPGIDTWQDRASTEHGGGGTWGSYTLDPVSGELFVPVGNPNPDFAPTKRPGANLYTDSLVVLDARTGKLKWYYQTRPNDGFDYDLGAAPALYADTSGHRRVAIGSKDGNLYALDRSSHHLVFRTAVTTIVNADKQPTPTGVRACPGALGGVEWNGPAFSPRTHMIYVGSVDWCMVYKSGDEVFKPGGQLNYGTDIIMPKGEPRSGWVTAVNADSGEVSWKFHAPAPIVAGVTVTAGGLVLTGDLMGDFYAFDASNGSLVKSIKFDNGLAGGVISYASGGKQYIAATVGNIGRLTFGGGGSPHVVVMTTGLPASYVAPILAVVAPEAANAAADPQHGMKVYSQFCVACHGTHGEGVPGAGATVQDESTRKNHAELIAWIKDPKPPMPKMYPSTISDADVEAVAQYVESLKKE